MVQWRERHRLQARTFGLLVLLAVALPSMAGCSSGGGQEHVGGSLPPGGRPSSTATYSPHQSAPRAQSIEPRSVLGPLVVDDDPMPRFPYDRAQWADWVDLDGDGCNTREEVLLATSRTPAQVDPSSCRVIAGDWRSAYDGFTTPDPSSLDLDHIVPLENAHESGAWAWTPQQRAKFANDVANLWLVSASSNRQKGSRTPDEWRPDRVDAWCEYSQRWVEVKLAYRLTVTTSERDALGQMLETC